MTANTQTDTNRRRTGGNSGPTHLNGRSHEGRDADQGDHSPLMLGAERVVWAIQKRIEIIDEQQIIGEQLGHEAFERARAFLQALDELASQRFFLVTALWQIQNRLGQAACRHSRKGLPA